MKKKATAAAIIIGTALSVSLPVYGAQWKQDSTAGGMSRIIVLIQPGLGADFWKLVLF